MSPAQRHRPRRLLVLSGVALAMVACRPRVMPLPLDSDDDRLPPPALAHGEAAAPQTDSLTEEDLPEVAATPVAPEPAALPPPPLAAPAPPAAGGELGATPIVLAVLSPLDTIHPGTPPNVAAATRLADAARIHLEAGQDAAALEQLERAIAIDPNNPYAYYFLAELHLHTRSYGQAIAFADRAAALSAASSPLWTSRSWALQGNAFEAAGRFADARQAYLRAVHAAPDNVAAVAGLARTGGAAAP